MSHPPSDARSAQPDLSSAATPTLPLRGGSAVRVFLCFAFAYLLSYAFRAINAVIAPQLSADLLLDNADLGLLSSAYFVSFALMQLPLGIALDRFGPRRSEAVLLVFAAGGAALFGLAGNLSGLWFGRALIGVGVSACLMASFTAFRAWFPAGRQGQLASWMLVAGTAGALITTVPVQWALPYLGWRGVFFAMAVAIGVAALGIWSLPRIGEGVVAAKPMQRAALTPSPGYRTIFTHPYFLRMLPIGVVNHGGFLALQTLWLGPWMTTVLGHSPQETARILFAFNLALLAGYLFNGWLTPRLEHAGVPLMRYVMALMALGIALQGSAVGLGANGWWWLWLGFALVSTVQILGQSTVALAFPASSSGRANTAYNLTVFVGAFAVQWGLGLAIDVFERNGLARIEAFRLAFAVLCAMQILAWGWFLVARPAATERGTAGVATVRARQEGK